MFYELRGVTGDVCVLYDELRVLARLMLGALGYEISSLFFKDSLSKIQAERCKINCWENYSFNNK